MLNHVNVSITPTFASENGPAIQMSLGAVIEYRVKQKKKSTHSKNKRKTTANVITVVLRYQSFNTAPESVYTWRRAKRRSHYRDSELRLSERKRVSSVQNSSTVPVITFKTFAREKASGSPSSNNPINKLQRQEK